MLKPMRVRNKFQNAFLDNFEVNNTFVDSLGNIFFLDSNLEKRIKKALLLDSTALVNIAIADTVKELNLNGMLKK